MIQKNGTMRIWLVAPKTVADSVEKFAIWHNMPKKSKPDVESTSDAEIHADLQGKKKAVASK